MDELCLGSQEVTGHLEVEHKNLHRPWTPQETPNKRDDSIYGVVTMETRMDREKEPMKKTEEDRWRELYPEIKKCVIVIARLRLDRVNVKLKQEKHGERMEMAGRRGRSGEPSSDWMEPVELDDSDGEGGFRSSVKKVEVRVRGNYAAANGSRKPRRRPRGAGLLRLRQCQSHDVNADTTDPAHWRHRQIRRNDKQISVNISQSEVTHNYSLNSKVPDTPDTLNGKSQDASLSPCCDHKDGDSCSCSTEKKNLPGIVFKKVRGDQWVLSSSKAKKEKEDSSVNTEQKKRRRRACGRCAACLRQDCGKCLYCLDKKKFGGPGKKKQRCQLRVCLVVESRFRPRPPVTSRTVTTATEPQQKQWKRRRDEEVEEMKAVKRTRRWRWGGGRATPRWTKNDSGGGQKNTPSAQEGKRRRRRRRRRSTGQRETEDDSWTQPLMKEEEEQKKETNTPQEGTEETAGQTEEDEECSEGVTEGGTYYEVEVEVPGSNSDEETLTASSTPSEVTEVPDDVTVSHPAYEPQDFISLSSGLFSLLGGGASDEVTCGRGLMCLLTVLRRTVLPDHWVPVLAAGPLLQLLQCSKLSSMTDTIVHVQPDHCFYITVQSRPLPDTHTLYTTHTPRITHLSQLVSLLLELEQLIVCRGLRVQSPACRLEVRSPTCHLLVAPPCLTCLPCLLQGEEEETDVEEDGDEGWNELTSDL